jgi:hypothetical protein
MRSPYCLYACLDVCVFVRHPMITFESAGSFPWNSAGGNAIEDNLHILTP